MGTEKRDRNRVELARRKAEANTLAVGVVLMRARGSGSVGVAIAERGLASKVGGGAKI